MNIFYLGTHRPSWLERTEVPLFISRRVLIGRRKPISSRGPWVLDSGGFTELSMNGRWTVSPKDYVAEVERWADPNMQWVAPQDWMCEPWIIEKSGLSVTEHQFRTVENYLTLTTLAPHLPFIPVLQGWTRQEYEIHAQMYLAHGVDLRKLPLVGLGSVCRRQQTQGGREVVQMFAEQGIKLHGFGMKTTGLKQIGYLLESSDSMAWSYRARRSPPLPGHTHKACNNCMEYALRWRAKVLETLRYQQPHLVA